MNYTSLITKKKQYKYSVNICFDLRNEERLADFIPNVTTTEILREYLGGIIRRNAETHSRILYGSYGTGKSHLLTVLCAVLGQINTSGLGFDNFADSIGKYDQGLASDIKTFVHDEKPYLVVPIYSDYPDFGKCITFSLKKELDRNGIKVGLKGYYDEALALLDKWLIGDESKARLEEECEKVGTTSAELQEGLSIYDLKYEDIFRKIYAGISYGAEFNSTAGNFIDNINIVNDAIKDRYRGIVIVFDEFGRYVEDYGEELKVKTIQDLAEYCDHSGYDNHLILVSHKQLSIYTGTMKKSISDEWKKIEGRFKSTSINVKYDQCLSLIGNIIPKTRLWRTFKSTHEAELNDLYNQVWDFNGFLIPPDMDEENPLESGFPLHPITLFSLDRLSKKVAQNERTFFTYLAGDEENALFSQLEKYDTKDFHFVGLDSLYDYFEENIRSFKTDDAYAVYKRLQIALNKLGQDEQGFQIRILKAIAVIDIISSTEELIADRTTLINVIDGNKKQISSALDNLEKKKIIRFMRHYGYYDFFDSSVFDLDAMIEERLSGITNEMVVSILNEQFAGFAVYPYGYNEQFHVNRVFLPLFAQKSDLIKKSFHNLLPDYYDGAIIFVLDDRAEEASYSDAIGLPERSLLLVNGKSKAIEEEVKRYIAVNYYYTKRDELAKDDPTVVAELQMYLSEQEAIVVDLVRNWRSLQDPGTFIMLEGKRVQASSLEELSTILSNMMQNSFPETIVVNNDLLNKNNLTGVMRQARRKALDSIIQHNNIYEDCRFLSPEFNILRATLSKNVQMETQYIPEEYLVADEDLNRLSDGTISGEPVMRALTEMLACSENKRLPLKEMYRMLKSEPYGLRDGYIPVLIAYSLKKYQNISLYFHGNEHSYTSEELVEALSDPDDYTLFICNWSGEQIEYIDALEEIFSDFISREGDLNRLEKLFRAMNSHYASITKSARTTDVYVSDITKKYRNIIEASHTDYNRFFFEILPTLNRDLQELAIQIRDIKADLESVIDKQHLRVSRIIRKVFEVQEHEDLLDRIHKIYLVNWEQKSQKAFDYTTNAILDLVSKSDKLSEKQFVFEIAKVVTGFDLSYWTDTKITDFENILVISVNKLNEYTVTDELQQGEIKITIESAGGDSIVSQFSQEKLSPTALTLLNKINSTLNNFGDAISYEQKIAVMTQILKEIIS